MQKSFQASLKGARFEDEGNKSVMFQMGMANLSSDLKVQYSSCDLG